MSDGGWETQTRAALVEECRRRGLPVSGSKADLVERLTGHVDQPPATPTKPEPEPEPEQEPKPEQEQGQESGGVRVDGDRMTRTYPADTNPRQAREQFVTDATNDGYDVPGGWPTVRRATRQTSGALTLTATVRRRGA